MALFLVNVFTKPLQDLRSRETEPHSANTNTNETSETGGTRHVDILRDADSISFFHVNLPYYFIRNGVEETKERCLWGYRKLPDNLKKVVAEFDYQNKELELLVRACIGQGEQ